MSMSNKEFSEVLREIEIAGGICTAMQLRARDTAQREALAQLEGDLRNLASKYDALSGAYATQREALARVEAERDALKYENAELAGSIELEDASNHYRERQLKAQLAEVVGILQTAMCEPACVWFGRAEAFLTRHAQAEQQESQGAQAEPANFVQELEAFEEWAHKNWPGAERKMLERDAQGAYKNSIYRDYFTGWQARAALATQPAEWADQLYTQGFDAGAAASKRLNAVRGAEHE